MGRKKNRQCRQRNIERKATTRIPLRCSLCRWMVLDQYHILKYRDSLGSLTLILIGTVVANSLGAFFFSLFFFFFSLQLTSFPFLLSTCRMCSRVVVGLGLVFCRIVITCCGWWCTTRSLYKAIVLTTGHSWFAVFRWTLGSMVFGWSTLLRFGAPSPTTPRGKNRWSKKDWDSLGPFLASLLQTTMWLRVEHALPLFNSNKNYHYKQLTLSQSASRTRRRHRRRPKREKRQSTNQPRPSQAEVQGFEPNTLSCHSHTVQEVVGPLYQTTANR